MSIFYMSIYVTGFFNLAYWINRELNYSLASTQPPQPISILIIEIEPTIVLGRN